MIKALLVDDEIGAIKNLQVILNDYSSSIEVIGYATTTQEAEFKLKHLKPDLVFLDIEMPGESGIEFLQRINFYDFEVVFVTAYSEFAIKAFKLNAIDYILKPIDLKEFKDSMIRISETFELKQKYKSWLTQERLETLYNNDEKEAHQKIILRNKDKLELVDFKYIVSLEADGTYSIFSFLRNNKIEKLIMSYPLAYYSDILPESTFLRVHKSHIVNINYIEEIEKSPNHSLKTSYGNKIPISKRRVQSVMGQLKK